MGQKNDSHLQKMLLFAPQLPPDLIRITDNHIQTDNRLQNNKSAVCEHRI